MPASQNVTREGLKEMLDLQQDMIIKFFNNHVDKLERKIDLLSDENKSLRADVASLKTELGEMKETAEFLSEKYDKISVGTGQVKDSEIKKLKTDNEMLSAKVTELEDRSRRNNLRFDGISEMDNEDWGQSEQKVRDFITSKLDIDATNLQIERCHRVGGKKDNRNRTIVCKFLNYKDREHILNRYIKEKLWQRNLYVNEDFCSKTVEIRKQLFSEVKKQREQGKRVKVVYNKIVSHSDAQLLE